MTDHMIRWNGHSAMSVGYSPATHRIPTNFYFSFYDVKMTITMAPISLYSGFDLMIFLDRGLFGSNSLEYLTSIKHSLPSLYFTHMSKIDFNDFSIIEMVNPDKGSHNQL
ncbi:hypothetical protein AB4Z22_15840 [Paenibacillus sp. TAF58]